MPTPRTWPTIGERLEHLLEAVEEPGAVVAGLFDQAVALHDRDHGVGRGGRAGVTAEGVDMAEDRHGVDDRRSWR